MIAAGKRAYFRERFKGRVFSWLHIEMRVRGLTVPDVQRANGWSAAYLKNRLSGPANLTLDDLSDLVLAIMGGELVLERRDVVSGEATNAEQARCEHKKFGGTTVI